MTCPYLDINLFVGIAIEHNAASLRLKLRSKYDREGLNDCSPGTEGQKHFSAVEGNPERKRKKKTLLKVCTRTVDQSIP